MRERRKWRRGSKMARAVRRHRCCRVVKRVERFDGDEWRTGETGLISYLRRFYRPDHGRWLNRDPIEERGGANLYGFCGNNCCAYIDAKGESFEDVSNFMAGVADSMTFGLTSLARKGINCSMYGEWEDPAESRVAIEGGARQAFRRANGLVGKGGYVHHVNPIKGHHTGSLARCPLPFEWAARGSWNMVWYPTRAEHVAAHEYLMVIESLDKARSMTMISRQGVNAIIQHLNSSESIKCWDGIDMSVKIDYTSGGDDSSLPVSASVFFEEYGRSE